MKKIKLFGALLTVCFLNVNAQESEYVEKN